VQLWLYATPVMYTAAVVPSRWRPLFGLNPMAGLVDGFRAAVLGTTPLWPLVGTSAVVAVLVLVAGVVFFRQVERRFVDVV